MKPTPRPTPSMRAGIPLLLFLFSLIVYLRGFHGALFGDDAMFLGSPQVLCPPPWPRFFLSSPDHHYAPLYNLINVTLFRSLQGRPLVMRGINIILFASAVLMLRHTLIVLSIPRRAALFTSLLFAVHPIQALTVLHITSNFILCAFLLQLLALLGFDRACRGQGPPRTWMGVSLLAQLTALLFFEGAVLLPILFFIIRTIRDRIPIGRTIKEILPWGLLSLIDILLWMALSRPEIPLSTQILSLGLSPAGIAGMELTLMGWYLIRLLTGDGIVLLYALAPGHYEWPAMIIAVLFLMVGPAACVLRTRPQATPTGRRVLWGLCWFLTAFLLLLPAGFAHATFGMVVEPHWFFFHAVGFFLLIGLGLDALGRLPRMRLLPIPILAFLVWAWGIRTQQLIHATRNERAYNAAWQAANPYNPLPRISLARLAAREGRLDEARGVYLELLRTKIYDRPVLLDALARIALLRDDLPAAGHWLGILQAESPDDLPAFHTRAVWLLKTGKKTKAETSLRKALRKEPCSAPAADLLSRVTVAEGSFDEALSVLRPFDAAPPDDRTVRRLQARTACLYLKKGLPDEGFRRMEILAARFPSKATFRILSMECARMGLEGLAASLRRAGEGLRADGYLP